MCVCVRRRRILYKGNCMKEMESVIVVGGPEHDMFVVGEMP